MIDIIDCPFNTTHVALFATMYEAYLLTILEYTIDRWHVEVIHTSTITSASLSKFLNDNHNTSHLKTYFWLECNSTLRIIEVEVSFALDDVLFDELLYLLFYFLGFLVKS